MNKPIKRVATIHDLCGVGKAALTNIIPVLSTLGVEVCPIPTMILSTHTGGFGLPSITKLEEYITKAFNHYKAVNIKFDGIFIGYLGSDNNVDEMINLLKSTNNCGTLIVFDPIFGDNGSYYNNFNKKYSDKLKLIIKYSQIITPNFTEACLLTDEKTINYADEDKLLLISRKLHSLGCENIIITSVPCMDNSKIGTSIYDGKKDSIMMITNDRIEKSYPGTGDIFTAVLIGMILKGVSIYESSVKACKFVEKCILESIKYNYPTKEGVLLEKVLNEINYL